MLKITKTLRHFFGRLFKTTDIENRLERIQESIGRIELRQLQDEPDFQKNEFRVSSQWGEDGLIQFLIRKIRIERKIFVEFGVENYKESNTRFLLTNNRWSGLVIDGSEEHIHFIKSDDMYWRYNLKAVCSFITAENINQLLIENGIKGEIGLLSIDIDGNDYWVWKAITVVNPAIVSIEYNYRFGKDRAVTVPYKANFRREDHPSLINFGASLKAICHLAHKKNYGLVGSNSTGLNAFFVRRDLIESSGLREVSAEEGYIKGHFRGHLENGKLKVVSPDEEIKLAENFDLVDVIQDDDKGK